MQIESIRWTFALGLVTLACSGVISRCEKAPMVAER